MTQKQKISVCEKCPWRVVKGMKCPIAEIGNCECVTIKRWAKNKKFNNLCIALLQPDESD